MEEFKLGGSDRAGQSTREGRVRFRKSKRIEEKQTQIQGVPRLQGTRVGEEGDQIGRYFHHTERFVKCRRG